MDSETHVCMLKLLGTPTLRRIEASEARPLERKAAGLLAWLAFEGKGERGELARLLWPDSPEAVGRNNLAQLLLRLRRLAEGMIRVDGHAAALSLAGRCACDATALLAAQREGCSEVVAGTVGVLLAGLNYDDCPEFQAWLERQRARLLALQCGALAALADAAAAAGRHHEGVAHARQLAALEPCSELAHARLMRLLWLAGDRPAALAAYEQCRETLRRELGVAPGEATRELMRAIVAESPASAVERPRPLPATLLRPPMLAGREAILEMMETAWRRGQAIFIGGPPGVGKTRLMQEFLAAKGRFHVFEGRPEDVGVPYATHSRTYRQMFAAFPGLALPDWVRDELARFLPELGPSSGLPERAEDRLRFFHAQAEATRLAVAAGMRLVVVDDLQFADLASLEAGHFVYAQHWGRTDGMRTIMCFRTGELLPEAQRAMEWVLDRGYGVLVTPPLLDAAQLARMIESVEPRLAGLVPQLHAHTGGNPYFALECVKALYETGQIDAGVAGRLPVPDKVRTLLEQRVSRLSAAAQDLARLAALAGARFTPQLAARALDMPLAKLAAPWAELEAAQILVGNEFVHALMQEAVHRGIPAPLAARLEAHLKR